MAETDGSIRIGVSMDLDDAKKQLEHLRNRANEQTKAIEKQASAVKKLEDDYKKLISEEEKSGKKAFDQKTQSRIDELRASLSAQTAELKQQEAQVASLEQQYEALTNREKTSAQNFEKYSEIRQKSYKMLEEAQGQMKAAQEEFLKAQQAVEAEIKSNPGGEVNPATMSALENAEYQFEDLRNKVELANRDIATLDDLLKNLHVGPASAEELEKVKTQIAQAKNQLGEMRAATVDTKLELSRLSSGPSEKAQELAKSIADAKNELTGLQNGAAQTKTEIGQTQEKVDGLNARLKGIRDSAHVADQGILDLRNELSELEKEKEDLEAAGLGLGFEEYDDVIVRIQEVKDELNDYKRSLEDVNSVEEQSATWKDALSSALSRVGSVVSVISRVAKASSNAIGGLKKRVSALGREKGFDKAAKGASRFGNRLKRIVTGAFFFNIISRSLSALTDQIGKYLTANTRFADALSHIKSNLLTAFQPVYDAVLPALSAMMEALESVTAKFASFMATIFGTTASQAQKNAEALYEQANATEEAGDAAKDAEKAQKKYLASFDTIEKLGEDAEKASEKEDKDKLKFDTDFDKIQPPQWLLDFWKVFQDGWNKYGAPTVQAFKDAIAAIKGAVAGILSSFLSVWTDGTGLEFLGRVYQLLQTIFGIIADIANAFKAAWDSKGEALIQALFYMLNSVLDLIIRIGQSFRAAWNDGSGVAICETILQIITNIFNIVGNLANRLREAWEANGNGEAIWNAILDIVQIILETFEKITSATAKWAETLNLEPLISSIREMLENLVPVIRIIGDTIASIFEKRVLPFLSEVIETHIPNLIRRISDLLGWLGENQKVLEFLTEAVLAFIAAWKILTVIQSIHSVLTSLNPVLAIIQLILTAVILIISHFDTIAEVVGRVAGFVVKSFEWIIELIQKATQALFDFASALSGGIGSASVSLNASGAKTGSPSRSPRAAFASELAAYSIKDLPHLANGAVISPNNEFLAVMGDQKSGTNIETPAALMKQMFLEAMEESGLLDGSVTDVNVNFTGSMAQVVRAMQPEITAETRRRGPQLVK